MSFKQVVMNNNGQIPEDLVSASLEGRGKDDMEKASNVFDTVDTLKSINELPQTVNKVKTFGTKIGNVFKGSKAATSTVEAGHTVEAGLKAGKGITKVFPKLAQTLGGKGAVAAGETVATGAGGGSGLLGGLFGGSGSGTILGGLFGGGGAAAGGTAGATAAAGAAGGAGAGGGAAGLGALLASNPVGWVVAAVLAVGVGTYFAVKGIKSHNESGAMQAGIHLPKMPSKPHL